jgi:hypothetical protein
MLLDRREAIMTGGGVLAHKRQARRGCPSHIVRRPASKPGERVRACYTWGRCGYSKHSINPRFGRGVCGDAAVLSAAEHASSERRCDQGCEGGREACRRSEG